MIDAGIVGLGWWGRRMVEAVHQRGEALRFACACVRDLDKSRDFAAQHGIRLTARLDEILHDPQVAAVVLATPHSQHVDQIVACAAAGKHVFSEKPLALTLDEAARAVVACERAGVVLGLGIDRRFLPGMRRLCGLVADGSLGELLHLEAQYSNDNMNRGVSGGWRDDPAEAPGAGMTGPGVHVLDALISLAGPVAAVCGHMTEPLGPGRGVDTVALLLRFAAGPSGLLGVVRGVPDYYRIAVFGTEGWAELRQFGTLSVALAGREPYTEQHDPALAIAACLEAFAGAATGGPAFPVGRLAMLDTVAAFEAAVTALTEPGWHAVPLRPYDAAIERSDAPLSDRAS